MATLKGVWSSSFASSSWSKSWSTSPLRSGTLAIVRTPGPGRDADAAKRRDHAAPRGLREVEAGGLGREEVGDVAGDQRAGGGHADEDRADPGADAGAGLLAERGVGLVADDDRVGVGDAAGVAHEPLVGLDRDGAVGMVGVVQQRRREPLAVAAVGDLADELVDQVAAVGEDQDAAGARGLDEADRGDGLAGAGGVLEPEAPVGARVLGHLVADVLVLLGLVPVLGLLVGLERVIVIGQSLAVAARRRGAVAGGLGAPVRGAVGAAVLLLELGDQRRQRSREGVHLVIVQLGAVGQVRDVLVQQPLEAEHQRVVAAPLDRWGLAARVDLGQGGVERAPAGACPARGPWASRPRAGRARARTRERARYRRR